MNPYEQANAQSWLDSAGSGATPPSSHGQQDWQVVSAAKKISGKPNQRGPPPKAPRRRRRQQQQQQIRLRPAQWSSARQPVRRLARVPRLAEIDENEESAAQRAWRENKEPSAKIQIPLGLAISRKEYEAIATIGKTFIHSEDRSGSAKIEFGIWSDPKDRGAAKLVASKIEKWIQDNSKTAASSKFSKNSSLTPKLRSRMEKQWERQVKREQFRRFPPGDMAFQCIASFHWPQVDHPADTIFGPGCQALDPIRMDCSCYLVFSTERSSFQVCGKLPDVKEALKRLRMTTFQIAARMLPSVRRYLLLTMPPSVVLKQYHHPVKSIGATPHTSLSPRGTGSIAGEDEYHINADIFRRTVRSALRKVQFFRGHLSLRASLGTFILTRYIPSDHGVFDIDDLLDQMNMEEFESEVTDSTLHGQDADKILPAIQHANHLLTTQEWGVTDLSSVKPSYTVTFVFEQEHFDLQLSISFDASFQRDKVRWTKHERDVATSLVDISFADLNTGYAWKFELAASQAVDASRLSKELVKFADNVKIEPDQAKKGLAQRPFVTFFKLAYLKSFRQEISHRYAVKETDFILELSHVQERSWPTQKSYVEQVEAAITEPWWSVSMYRIEWETNFAANERLPIGARCDWDPDVDAWFPADIGPNSPEEGGDAFAQLMTKMQRVGNVVADVREEIAPST